MDLIARSRVFGALADLHRLAMVDALALGDLTAREVAHVATVPMNLASHHLRVLEEAGLIERRISTGDRRRRYVVLRPEHFLGVVPGPIAASGAGPVLFVCTHNSARSQFAAGLWRERTGEAAISAGSAPSPRVAPLAVRAAGSWGVNLAGAVPSGYSAVEASPGLVVSVCDRAREGGVPFEAPAIHWAVPDPVAEGSPAAFTEAFAEIEQRIDRLAAAFVAA
jgi:ArsR family transcriptional regulator, arsenate/arsenite/antimonite-responsive transcriptional repressor / arsenate reductase (thioredoxin)